VRITDVWVRKIRGTVATGANFWEDRQVGPMDVYQTHRNAPLTPPGGRELADGRFALTAHFLEVDTDKGVSGRAGPISGSVARTALARFGDVTIGADPFATELIWDQAYRRMDHDRQSGEAMEALSALDCALWDLKGRALNLPIVQLLGGPVRPTIPAYASMLGFAVDDLGRVRETAQEFADQGYWAQKWFFRHGPASGLEGMRQNVALVRTLRETLGDDYDLMFDAWQAWTVDYAAELGGRIAELSPRWLEEPILADRLDSHRRLRERVTIPLAGGEHTATRWGAKALVDTGALDVLQPDIYWAGGLSETLKIAALASAHDVAVIPHNKSTAITIHLSLAQSPAQTPYQEYLVKWNVLLQHFLAHRIEPRDGELSAADAPGAAMDLDPDRIEGEERLER